MVGECSGSRGLPHMSSVGPREEGPRGGRGRRGKSEVQSSLMSGLSFVSRVFIIKESAFSAFPEDQGREGVCQCQ